MAIDLLSEATEMDVEAHEVTAVLATAGLSGVSLEVLERAAILNALERFSCNRTRAAKSLGISVRTLQRKLKLWPTYQGGAVLV